MSECESAAVGGARPSQVFSELGTAALGWLRRFSQQYAARVGAQFGEAEEAHLQTVWRGSQ